jgi:hypothetical protein
VLPVPLVADPDHRKHGGGEHPALPTHLLLMRIHDQVEVLPPGKAPPPPYFQFGVQTPTQMM